MAEVMDVAEFVTHGGFGNRAEQPSSEPRGEDKGQASEPGSFERSGHRHQSTKK